MKELSSPTKIYLYATYLAGVAVFVWNIYMIDFSNFWMILILCVLASLALILKVEGATNRSHYTFSFLVYGFTFVSYGTSEAILVILISNLVEWIWNRPPWFIQLFNTGSYILVMQVASFLYQRINSNPTLASWQAPLAIALSMASFNLLNHLMVGIVLWLARGENFKKSGIFDFFPLMLDLALLYYGASLSFVWTYNQFALVLFLIPIYLIYNTLRVPALERQTETDNKTGLFNHGYFKQQLDNELNRANRFDRPLAIIMADLDLLRNINNTYGHLAGDEVLIGVAKILKQSVREYDVAARFGGEEFAILLPETTIQQAHERAEYIRKAIEESEFTVPTSVSPIRATMSFGIACRESFGQTTDEIIHNADTALYRSKLNGRNRAFAYANESYVNLLNVQNNDKSAQNSVVENSQYSSDPIEEDSSQLARQRPIRSVSGHPLIEPSSKTASDGLDKSNKPYQSKLVVNLYIGTVTLISLVFFVAIYKVATPMNHFGSASE